MKRYDNIPDDELEAVYGSDQLNAPDDDVANVVNGGYDDLLAMSDDELDALMDADDDMPDIGDVDSDAAMARAIVEECQGVYPDGKPKAAVSIILDMVSQNMKSKRTIAQQSIYKPVVYINRRMEFIEIAFEFPTELDANLKVMFANVEKYGQKQNEYDELSTEAPMFSLTLIPVAALGSMYIVAINPIFWAIQPKRINEPAKILKMLFKCDEVGFYQTDEIDMGQIQAELQREMDARAEMLDIMERKEEEQRNRNSSFSVRDGANYDFE